MLVIHGTLVLPEARLLADGALLLEGARIAAVGPSEELGARYAGEERLDARGMLVLPGLINAHTHLYATLGRGKKYAGTSPSNLALREQAQWRALVATLDYELVRYTTLVGCIEALRAGTTTLFDWHLSPAAVGLSLDAIAEATLEAGVRACLAYGVSDAEGVTAARQAVQENARFARRVRGEALLAATMGLAHASTLSSGTLSAAVGAAGLAGIGCHIQMGEDPAEGRDTLTHLGVGPVERLKKFGALGPRSILADSIHLAPEEMGLLAQSQAWVVHTPRSNLVAGYGAAPVGEMLARGVQVGLGTNGLGVGIFPALRAAYDLARSRSWPTREPLEVEAILRLAFQANSALASRFFGQRIGELAPGAAADLILVNYAGPAPITPETLPWHLVLGAEALAVDTTVVAGRVLLRQGQLTTLDEQVIYARARELAGKV